MICFPDGTPCLFSTILYVNLPVLVLLLGWVETVLALFDVLPE
jgi:hypothetical protein